LSRELKGDGHVDGTISIIEGLASPEEPLRLARFPIIEGLASPEEPLRLALPS